MRVTSVIVRIQAHADIRPAETRVMLLARRRNKRREDDSRRDDGLATSDVVLQQMRENVRQMFRSSKGCHVEMKYADPALPRAKGQDCGSCPTSLLHAEQVDEGARVLNRPGQRQSTQTA